ncbi:pancreatic triacylglycerol lipase-like [Bactrocera neohumeralis]|uniref:pancreatic triacylglycerol lipase-like n=1 Tax=Bactrocera tryoni TaxID=59916 RepID=UPI001A9A18D8|nr:pancreatic triacylglycerol lipase-like [Bactrocera tryoni]XP_050328055.1 pancreatic triacylglycerol lipase-like [Bactrocera neohumeralis]
MANAVACICNIIHPCRNEISGTFVLLQWLVTGIAAIVKVVRPVWALFGVRTHIPLRDEDYNTTWMYMANGDGDAELAYLLEPPPEVERNMPMFIQFEYYTGNPTPFISNFSIEHYDEATPQQRHEIDEWDELLAEFKPELDTKMLVHGWKSSTQSRSIQSIREAYTKRGKLNVFAINWRDQADSIYYLKPARYAIHVGRAVSRLIDSLVEERQADPQRIHLIGHSLGAHIMGYAGSYARHRVGRITGLDPARPAFENCIGPENHLDATDAEFVDVIHSCAGVLGFQKPIGSVDFYPNGGRAPQPGCSELAKIFTGCSHGRSHEYFAESINSEKGFHASACNSYEDVKAKNCTGERILMGDPVPLHAKGVYFLKTADKPNFALGIKGCGAS